MKSSAEFPAHRILIASWIAMSKEFANFHKLVSITYETEKAYQIKFEGIEEEFWIPKSQCQILTFRDSTIPEF